MSLIDRRPKVADVAARAGVSTATVDRVINGRGGVHQRTVQRVEDALREIAGREQRGLGAQQAACRFDAVLSGDGGGATKALADAFIRAGEAVAAEVSITLVDRMEPVALADRLRRCAERGSSGIAVQVLDHALVQEAVAELVRADIPVVTVLTDMAGGGRLAYVGLDNRAAGRTAGLLMARFCHRPGKLAIVWGGQLYRSHEERESGFRSILRAERPDLACLEVITGNDDPLVASRRISEVVDRHPDLAGIYCVGGGVGGVADAIDRAGLGQSLVMIAHNCNAQTRPYLLSGTIDAVIHQDMTRIADVAINALAARAPPACTVGIPVEIVTRENVMHR